MKKGKKEIAYGLKRLGSARRMYRVEFAGNAMNMQEQSAYRYINARASCIGTPSCHGTCDSGAARRHVPNTAWRVIDKLEHAIPVMRAKYSGFSVVHPAKKTRPSKERNRDALSGKMQLHLVFRESRDCRWRRHRPGR